MTEEELTWQDATTLTIEGKGLPDALDLGFMRMANVLEPVLRPLM